MSSSVG